MRRKDREITEIRDILGIVAKCRILHLGLLDDGYPYIVPLHFGYVYENETLVLYVHCAKAGHKLDLIRNDPHVCVEMECDTELVSGGENACDYSSYYASVIGRGVAEIVEAPEEKCRGLSLLMAQQTGRSFVITDQMASAVEVVKIAVSALTAKSKAKQT
ncbi:MAG: pyridoxamine 5'-phosphate oxidase family protein [Oscillospiraceae bacterium]|nr:pyridoxamine 5'-phosphate oxidase family protein [Oscillospiraceae bacterium]